MVTNVKGIGARGTPNSATTGSGGALGRNTYNYTGSLTTFNMPLTEQKLGQLSQQVFDNNDWNKLIQQGDQANKDAPKSAIPKMLGGKSPIKHVFLIIKENRTYDQVLGDIGKGESAPADVQYGQTTTPNQHALANQFTLFDNFFDEGTLSADGHNWLMQADANDYLEKQFGAFVRSYPFDGGDPLVYQKDGFLWNAAERAGNTVGNYGEYESHITLPNPTPTWNDWWHDAQVMEGKLNEPLKISSSKSYSDVPSLNDISNPAYPMFDTDIPDQYRADIWKQDFDAEVKKNKVPNLTLMSLPADHTGGGPGPVEQVADNDLAVGRIVDDISNSKIWDSSAVFVLEDDTQAGTDHIDGHRGPLWIASPYVTHDAIDSEYFTQLNVVKTIEQILGIQPMNQEDRAAEPMWSAFTNTPDLTPFTAQPVPDAQPPAPPASADRGDVLGGGAERGADHRHTAVDLDRRRVGARRGRRRHVLRRQERVRAGRHRHTDRRQRRHRHARRRLAGRLRHHGQPAPGGVRLERARPHDQGLPAPDQHVRDLGPHRRDAAAAEPLDRERQHARRVRHGQAAERRRHQQGPGDDADLGRGRHAGAEDGAHAAQHRHGRLPRLRPLPARSGHLQRRHVRAGGERRQPGLRLLRVDLELPLPRQRQLDRQPRRRDRVGLVAAGRGAGGPEPQRHHLRHLVQRRRSRRRRQDDHLVPGPGLPRAVRQDGEHRQVGGAAGAGRGQGEAATAAKAKPSKATRSLSAGSLATTGAPSKYTKIAQAWVAWSEQQRFGGRKPAVDLVNSAQLNRLDWYLTKGWKKPYPGDKKILAPNKVPGHNLPAGYLGEG